MRCSFSLILATALIASIPGLALAQAVNRTGGGIAGTAFGGGTTPFQVPLLTGQGRFGAGTGGTELGVGNATGGSMGAPRAASGGVGDRLTLGSSTGGIRGTGRALNAATGGVNDTANANGRNTGGILGSLTGAGGLGVGTGGIGDADSLGATTGGFGEQTAPRFQVVQ
jgi:hypothetical protein